MNRTPPIRGTPNNPETRSDKDLGLAHAAAFLPRALFVSSSKANGGADRHAVQLAIGLRDRGAQIVYACRPGKFTEKLCVAAGIPTVRFHALNSGDLPAAARLAAFLLSRRIEIVHVHARRDFVPVILAVQLARAFHRLIGRSGPRLLCHVHLIRSLGTPASLAGRFFEANSDAVIAVSDSTADFLNRKHALHKGFVRRIFNGVDFDAYALPGSEEARHRRVARRREWGIPGDAPVIGMVGRLYQKGQIDLLQTAPALIRRFPNLRIVLAGPFKFPGDHTRFAELAAHYGVSRNVVVAGIEEDVPGAMHAFDILVHLPVDEAFGLVLVEAMAAAVPVVATAVGGCREVVTDGETGLLVPANDPDALLSALGALLDPVTGPALRARIGAAGRRSAERYSARAQLDQLQALYTEILHHETRK